MGDGLKPEDYGKYLRSGARFYQEGVGWVHLALRANATRLTARRHGEIVKVSGPAVLKVGDLAQFLEKVKEQLPMTELPCYGDGQRIECPEVTFVIGWQSHLPNKILATPSLGVTGIEVGSALDLTDANVTRTITGIISKSAHSLAPKILLPFAHNVAERVGVHPARWTISTGKRILGHCSARRVIALSSKLVFMPKELREYIICHELAHLSEMNHSPRFHAICNRYCCGQEQKLEAQLKGFRYPLLEV